LDNTVINHSKQVPAQIEKQPAENPALEEENKTSAQKTTVQSLPNSTEAFRVDSVQIIKNQDSKLSAKVKVIESGAIKIYQLGSK